MRLDEVCVYYVSVLVCVCVSIQPRHSSSENVCTTYTHARAREALAGAICAQLSQNRLEVGLHDVLNRRLLFQSQHAMGCVRAWRLISAWG